ncbi:MAG: hypothetical protein ACRDRV_15775 [Pseudonocardiaceae bacterium]
MEGVYLIEVPVERGGRLRVQVSDADEVSVEFGLTLGAETPGRRVSGRQ